MNIGRVNNMSLDVEEDMYKVHEKNYLKIRIYEQGSLLGVVSE